jgi:type II secretory pathway pseudopilin PulG
MHSLKRRCGATSWQLAVLISVAALVCLGASQSFLEAQVRAKVARARANLGAMAVGLEAYRVDWAICPYDGFNYNGSLGQGRYNYWYPPVDLTTPVSYMSARDWEDPFRVITSVTHWQARQIRYTSSGATWGGQFPQLNNSAFVSSYYSRILQEYGDWRLSASGPDGLYGPTGWPGVSAYPSNPIPYDPTNGASSQGDVLRSQRAVHGYLNIPNPEGEIPVPTTAQNSVSPAR